MCVLLQPLETFITKIIQLYEMIVVRHGLMMVGWSYGMKTSCLHVLAAVLTDLNSQGLAGEHKVKLWTLNPKAVTMGQLYGEDDPVSKEWSDGVLAVAFRNAARYVVPNKRHAAWLACNMAAANGCANIDFDREHTQI